MMAGLGPWTVYRPGYGYLKVTPAGPVVDAWLFYTKSAADAYVCLGVIGNAEHLQTSDPGDHTGWSGHTAVINGRTVWPKVGWCYAVDGRVPEPGRFETWLLAQLRAGRYPEIKYWNINNRHWNRSNGFRSSWWSGDDHLHLSFMPTYENAHSSVLADYEAYRTGKKPAIPTTTTEDEDDDMSQQTIPVPAGFAYNAKGDLIDPEAAVVLGAEPAGFGPNPLFGSKRLYLSAMTDHTKPGAPVKLRVAVNDGAGYAVSTIEVKAGGRTAIPVGQAAGPAAYSITVGRIVTDDPDTASLPLALLVTVA